MVQSVLGMTKVAVTPRGSIYTLPIFDYKIPGQFNATLDKSDETSTRRSFILAHCQALTTINNKL